MLKQLVLIPRDFRRFASTLFRVAITILLWTLVVNSWNYFGMKGKSNSPSSAMHSLSFKFFNRSLPEEVTIWPSEIVFCISLLNPVYERESDDFIISHIRSVLTLTNVIEVAHEFMNFGLDIENYSNSPFRKVSLVFSTNHRNRFAKLICKALQRPILNCWKNPTDTNIGLQLWDDDNVSQLFLLSQQNIIFSASGVKGCLATMQTCIVMEYDQWKYLRYFRSISTYSLSQWHVPEIEIIVITHRRPQSLLRLLSSLKNKTSIILDLSPNSKLFTPVAISFQIDAKPDIETRNIVSSFKWPFGPKRIRIRIKQSGILPAIVESYYPTSSHHYAVIFEDDISVSDSYFLWIKLTLLQYRYSAPSFNKTTLDRNNRLFGISLYTPRIQEMTFPRIKIRLDRLMLPDLYSPLLWQLPCSWGAIYFPEIWLEFIDYLNHRLDENSNPINFSSSLVESIPLSIPNSRSNSWKQSWKRYFIEMIVFRGYFMLYPNFPDQASFSTNHLEPGIHIAKGSRTRLLMLPDFEVPLLNLANIENAGFLGRDFIMNILPHRKLPEINKLPLADLWLNFHEDSALVDYGISLHMDFIKCNSGESIARDEFGVVSCK